MIVIHPDNPQKRLLLQVAKKINQGGLGIVPTDGVYSFICKLGNKNALEKISNIKKLRHSDAQFSIICNHLSSLSTFVKNLDNSHYKILRKNLPGSFTFILEASKNVPRFFLKKRKTVGFRIPNHKIVLDLLEHVEGQACISSSVNNFDNDIIHYDINPEIIASKYEKEMDFIVDGGMGKAVPSAIVDLTKTTPSIIREGSKELIF